MDNEKKAISSPFDIDQMSKTGALREALNSALSAVRAGAKDPDLFYISAKIAYELGDMQKAEQLIAILLAADPEHINGWLLFGRIFHRKGDLARSGYGLKRAEEIFPAFFEIGIQNIAREIATPKKAESAVSGSTTLDPNFETETFADICVKQGYYNKALKIYGELKDKNPQEKRFELKIDEVKKKMGRHD
jgi:tetratricopeptide (TPR) repeat protein